MRIAVLGAVVVGSVAGGLAAWLSSPGSSAQAIAPSTAAPAIAQPAPASAAPSVVSSKLPAQPTSPAPPPDPQVMVVAQMRAVLARFAEWSRDHAGAPCPDGAVLGMAMLDPWRHPIELTCTDQPADQRIGAISGGADGVMGNDDDLASWTLGRDVTDLVRGARWKSARVPATGAPVVRRSKESSAVGDHTRVAPLTSRATTPAAPPLSTSPVAHPGSTLAPTKPSATKPSATKPSATKPSATSIDAGADDIPARR